MLTDTKFNNWERIRTCVPFINTADGAGVDETRQAMGEMLDYLREYREHLDDVAKRRDETIALRDTLERVLRPVFAVLNSNMCHPHLTLLIDGNTAELVEGRIAVKPPTETDLMREGCARAVSDSLWREAFAKDEAAEQKELVYLRERVSSLEETIRKLTPITTPEGGSGG